MALPPPTCAEMRALHLVLAAMELSAAEIYTTLLCGLASRPTVVIRLSSQGNDVTQTRVEES